jgi:hypothetical protein
MRRALLISLVLLLTIAGSAVAARPAGQPMSFSFPVPAKGHETIYALKVTGHVPAGTTLNGKFPVTVSATNASKIAKGVISAAVVIPTGSLTWDVFVVVNANNASGTGAATITGNVTLPPLPNVTEDETPIGPASCKKKLDLFHRTKGRFNEELTQFGYLVYWVFEGDSDSGKSTVSGAKCD